MTIEIGKTYKVSHRRKGTFTMVCTGLNDTFADGIVVNGYAQAILPENELEAGEEVTVRIDLCKFELIENAQSPDTKEGA